MERCFDCYCENGFGTTGIKTLAAACGMTSANLYVYFGSLDELIVESTAYCMSKIESEFMAVAPKNAADIKRCFEELPYFTAKKHGKKYRLMYQIYTHPKYVEYGKEFFCGVEKRYSEYAEILEGAIGLPRKIILAMIYSFVRACVHYALFEDEDYMKAQMELLWQTYLMANEKYGNKP